jgi:hypothetical protein
MNYFPPFFIAKKGGAKKSRPLGSFLENYVSFHCLQPNSQTPLANFQKKKIRRLGSNKALTTFHSTYFLRKLPEWPFLWLLS